MRRLQLLHRFHVVAEEGSLHAAALRLGITQPALTKSIQNLEDEFGLVLFDRHSKGVSLTTYGRKLMAHVRVIAREMELAEAELNFLQSGRSGMLNIGAGQTWNTVFLPPILVRLQRAFPEVHVNVWAGSGQGLLQNLIDGDIDVMVGGLLKESEDIPPYFTRQPLIALEGNIVARADHPLHDNPLASGSTLARYPWLVFKGDLGPLVNGRNQILAVTGTLPATITYTESVVALTRMIAAGDYLAFMSKPVAQSLREFGITSLNLHMAIPGTRSGVIYRSSIAGVAPFRFLLQNLTQAAQDYLAGERTRKS